LPAINENKSGFLDIRNIPYSLEAEQSVLGSIIISPRSYEEITDIISVDDFYLENHRQIFSAMASLYIKSRAIDLVTLLDEVKKSTEYDETRAREYISRLAESVPSAFNIKEYAAIVRDKSLRRAIIKAADEITSLAYESADGAEDIIDKASALIYALSHNQDVGGLTHLKQILTEVFDRLQKTSKDKEAVRGIGTGFSGVDNIILGMAPGNLILIGARPGMGKTSFAMNIAVHAAAKKKSIAVFSLEMSKTEIGSRVLAGESRIDSYKMQTGSLEDRDWTELADAAARLSESEIYIDDTPGINVTSMKTRIRKLKKVDLVIIDYLQLMQTDRRIDNRVQEVSDISRNLKILAKEMGIPVVTCAQLSRASEQRPDKRPQLSDLRDSGAIEQDADVVMFLYRDKDALEHQNRAEIIFAKNRHGAVGKVDLGWEGKFTRFYDIDRIHGE